MPTLCAGAAMIDVTPKAGTHIGGDWGYLRTAQTIADRLYARALVLELAGKKICIVSADLEIITEPWNGMIRRGAHERCGIEPDAVMVHLTQTHSAPPLGNFLIDEDFSTARIPPEHEYLRGSQSEYCRFAVEKIVEAIEQANRRLRPVQVAAGSAIKDNLAFNRRGVMRDGKVGMPWFYPHQSAPLGPLQYRYLEGPSDPEVGVVCFRDDDMNTVATLLHFTSHPVNMYATNKHAVTPDWPGAWSQGLQRICGESCVPIVLNGCCGNINPWPPFEPNFYPDHRKMGAALSEVTERIIRTLEFSDATTLDRRVKHLALPLKQLTPEQLAACEKMLAEQPTVAWMKDDAKHATWEWMDAAMMMSVHLERERNPDFDYEIQVFRIGDTAIVGLPGEPFVEGQLAIKIGSPAYPTYVAHNTTAYAGYIAPRESYPRGGHEIRDNPAKWARLAPGALEAIVEASVGMLKDVFAK